MLSKSKTAKTKVHEKITTPKVKDDSDQQKAKSHEVKDEDGKKAIVNKTSKKTSVVTWGPAASVIVVILIYVIAQLIALLLVNIYPALRHWDASQTSNWINSSVVGQFWFVVFVEGLSVYFLYLFLKRRHSSFRSIGLNRWAKLTDVGYAVAGFIVYFAVYYVVILILTKVIPSFNVGAKQDVGFSTSTHGESLYLVFISLVLLPPIVEEMLFRGFLYTGLRSKLNKIVAALITSAIFALPHVFEGTSGILWVAGVDTFILSLVLVYLREKTDALYSSMMVHMLKNFLAFATLFIFHVS
jgi:membrane protease YdiL (CAAX protease family)